MLGSFIFILPMALAGGASAQFSAGSILTSAALNAAISTPTIVGGSINGATIGDTNPKPITGSSLTVQSAPSSSSVTLGISAGKLSINSATVSSQTTLMESSVPLSNAAAAATATLLNAPTAGNPTKWIPIIDNGVTRYVPAW